MRRNRITPLTLTCPHCGGSFAIQSTRVHRWALDRIVASALAANERGCRESTLTTDRAGYPYIRNWPGLRPQRMRAHRVVCIAAHGPPPSEKPFALHTRDNPRCVEPTHLYWGDSIDNTMDRIRRGRSTGGQNGTYAIGHRLNQVLSEDTVRRIRAAVAAGRVQRLVAAEFGITQSAVSLIARRLRYREID